LQTTPGDLGGEIQHSSAEGTEMASGRRDLILSSAMKISRSGAFWRAWSVRSAAYRRQGAAVWRKCGIRFLVEVGCGRGIL